MNNFQLETAINEYLEIHKFKDYAPNGLQVEGTSEIKRVVTGVTASQALIDEAIAFNADLILVHHGYFWRGEDPRLIHMKYERIKKLIKHDMNLMGYHLPLDAHGEIGNNICLAQLFNIQNVRPLNPFESTPLVLRGEFDKALSPIALQEHIASQLGRVPILFGQNKSQSIKTIAWCSGAAQDYLEQAALAGVDAYLTGEVSERTFYEANEMGLYFFSAGHHATERYGIQKLGEWLARMYELDVKFVDCANPI